MPARDTSGALTKAIELFNERHAGQALKAKTLELEEGADEVGTGDGRRRPGR